MTMVPVSAMPFLPTHMVRFLALALISRATWLIPSSNTNHQSATWDRLLIYSLTVFITCCLLVHREVLELALSYHHFRSAWAWDLAWIPALRLRFTPLKIIQEIARSSTWHLWVVCRTRIVALAKMTSFRPVGLSSRKSESSRWLNVSPSEKRHWVRQVHRRESNKNHVRRKPVHFA